MRFTILADTGKYRPAIIAGLIAMLPLVILPFLADAGELPRALMIGLAATAAFTVPFAPAGKALRFASILLVSTLALVVLSAALNGWPSAVFGVHGRFQGLTSALSLACAAGLGAFVLSRRIRTLANWVSIATAVQAAAIGVQVAIGAEPAGFIGNRVPAGAALAIGAVISLTSGVFSEGKSRLLFFGAAGMSVLALGVTGSRGAWIAFAVGAAVIAYAVARSTKRSVVAGIAVALVVAVILGASVNAISSQKLQAQSLLTGSAASRWEIWRGTGAMIAENPVLGVGPGRFLYEFQRFEPMAHALAEDPDVRADQAHSLVLQTAAESGVPAALLATALAAFALWAGYRGIRAGDAASVIAGAGFATYAVQALLGVPSLGVDALGWVLGGILVARLDRSSAGDERAGGKRGATAQPVGGHQNATAWRVAVSVVGATVLGLSLWYAVADYSFDRANDYFAAARFDEAMALSASASALNPLVDTYRVGIADAAGYAGPASVQVALSQLERGIALEPASYDLLLARARLLNLASAAPADVAAAYADAVDSYPLGLTVNLEASRAFELAGRRGEADSSARIVETLAQPGMPGATP